MYMGEKIWKIPTALTKGYFPTAIHCLENI